MLLLSVPLRALERNRSITLVLRNFICRCRPEIVDKTSLKGEHRSGRDILNILSVTPPRFVHRSEGSADARNSPVAPANGNTVDDYDSHELHPVDVEDC